MSVYWSENALLILRDIFAHISGDSPEKAKSVVDRITSRSEQIALFPRSGRIVPEFDMPQIREIMENQYRIIYHIEPDKIQILTVIHTSMDFEDIINQHKCVMK